MTEREAMIYAAAYAAEYTRVRPSVDSMAVAAGYAADRAWGAVNSLRCDLRKTGWETETIAMRAEFLRGAE